MRNSAMQLLLFLAMVGGCGGGNSHRIICFGDSLTAGPQLAQDQTYPAVLERILQRRGYRYEVVNAGVSGETTSEGIDRINPQIATPADILILELGTNDVYRGVPAEKIRQNLAEMIRRAQSRHIIVVLAGIQAPPESVPEYASQVPALFRSLATEYKVQLIPDFMAEVKATPGAMRSDGVHYKAKGAEVLARSMFRHIQPLLAK